MSPNPTVANTVTVKYRASSFDSDSLNQSAPPRRGRRLAEKDHQEQAAPGREPLDSPATRVSASKRRIARTWTDHQGGESGEGQREALRMKVAGAPKRDR